MFYYDINKSLISYAPSTLSNQNFTTPAGCCYIRFWLQTDYGIVYNHDVSINYPSSNTQYNAYNNLSGDYNIVDIDSIIAFNGDNNIFADIGDITVQYKDTIQNYIDTRVNTVSNRSLSMMRTLETLEKSVALEKSVEIERGETDEKKDT